MSAWKPIKEIAVCVNNGEISAAGMVEQSLRLIRENEDYKSLITTLAEPARQRAREIDERIKNGEELGMLAGVPFIAKDNFLVYGADTTAASNILMGFEAPYQSTAIERLEAEGAICVAKANLDAFAHGSSTENSDFFTTLNPHDKTKVPGGSSGGSAAAVALELAPFALGTDTGGSIRLPASFCGIVGYKPTYGLVSRSGVVAMASSTDVIGPLTRTMQDAATVLECMAGPDELDGTTIDRESNYDEVPNIDLSKLKIGVIKEYLSEGLNEGVKKQVLASVEKLRSAGAVIEEISLPSLPLALAVYYIICPAEVSSNLSRYDGQRFGHSVRKGDLEASYQDSRSTGLGDEAKRRIMIGTYVLSSGYYDAYYQKAQLVRTKIINELKFAFARYDALIGPTAPVTAFNLGEHSSDPLEMYLMDIMTVASNLAGNPAVSIPCGTSDGMPVGLQILADLRQDKKLLMIAKAFEEKIT